MSDTKTCPSCGYIIPAQVTKCQRCGNYVARLFTGFLDLSPVAIRSWNITESFLLSQHLSHQLTGSQKFDDDTTYPAVLDPDVYGTPVNHDQSETTGFSTGLYSLDVLAHFNL